MTRDGGRQSRSTSRVLDREPSFENGSVPKGQRPPQSGRYAASGARSSVSHGESRNPVEHQERSRSQSRDSVRSSASSRSGGVSSPPAQETSDYASLFRSFLGNLPGVTHLEEPRQKMRSIERSLSMDRSEATSRSSRSMDQSEASGFIGDEQSAAAYSSHSDPFHAKRPGRFQSNPSETPRPLFDDQSMGSYSSRSASLRARGPQQRRSKSVPPQSTTGESFSHKAASERTNKSFSPLSWRLHPRESLSDWQIKVVRTNSGTEDLYHVHRMVLAVGPRKSEYFADLFQKQIQDHNSHRLRLEMPDEIAVVFPVLLDYLYGTDDIPSVRKRKHAFAVYDQAEYFHMPGLKTSVANWFRRRLQWFDVPRYLKDIQRYKNNDPLETVAVEKCMTHFEELGPPFAKKISPKMMVQVFELLAAHGYVFHQNVDYVSAMIVECAVTHQVDRDTFASLTRNRFLPTVPPTAAVTLLTLDAQWSNPSDRRLSCLETRCVRTLARHWEYLCYEFPSAEAMADSLAHLPAKVLAQLLVRTASVPW